MNTMKMLFLAIAMALLPVNSNMIAEVENEPVAEQVVDNTAKDRIRCYKIAGGAAAVALGIEVFIKYVVKSGLMADQLRSGTIIAATISAMALYISTIED